MTFEPRDSAETERLRAAFTSTLDAEAPSGDCLPPDDVLAAVRDELPPDELRRVLGHVAECALCTEAWRLAQALEEEATTSSKSARPVWRKAAGFLAAAMVVLVAGVVVQRQWSDRELGPERVTRAGATTELALEVGTEPLPREACALRWTSFEGALYDVTVSTEDLDTLSKAVDLDRPEYLVPAAHLPATQNTGLVEPLLVYIEVHRPGEGTVASGTFAFTIR